MAPTSIQKKTNIVHSRLCITAKYFICEAVPWSRLNIMLNLTYWVSQMKRHCGIIENYIRAFRITFHLGHLVCACCTLFVWGPRAEFPCMVYCVIFNIWCWVSVPVCCKWVITEPTCIIRSSIALALWIGQTASHFSDKYMLLSILSIEILHRKVKRKLLKHPAFYYWLYPAYTYVCVCVFSVFGNQ